MRAFVLALLLVPLTAHADDGYFIEESIGGASYRGDLAQYADGAPRFQIGFNVRRGEWAVELFGGFAAPDFFFIDCYDETACAPAPAADLTHFGVDVRRHYTLGKPRWKRLNANMFLHAGPRWFDGSEALAGFRGPGIGGGAGIEINAWVIGYYVDFGMDMMWLDGPNGNHIMGSMPYVMFGGKVGWL